MLDRLQNLGSLACDDPVVRKQRRNIQLHSALDAWQMGGRALQRLHDAQVVMHHPLDHRVTRPDQRAPLLASRLRGDDTTSVEDMRRHIRGVDVFEPPAHSRRYFPHARQENMAVDLIVGVALVEVAPHFTAVIRVVFTPLPHHIRHGVYSCTHADCELMREQVVAQRLDFRRRQHRAHYSAHCLSRVGRASIVRVVFGRLPQSRALGVPKVRDQILEALGQRPAG